MIIETTSFVNEYCASNTNTRKSHTGYVVFINKIPAFWYIKRQKFVDTSTFSSDFIAPKACTEVIVYLQFNLQMFGVPSEYG